jgi:hypothetical protein
MCKMRELEDESKGGLEMSLEVKQGTLSINHKF